MTIAYQITYNGIVIDTADNSFDSAEEAVETFHRKYSKLAGEYGIRKITKEDLPMPGITAESIAFRLLT